MIGDYFEFLGKVANKFSHTKKVRFIKVFEYVDKGFMRCIIELNDDSELHVF